MRDLFVLAFGVTAATAAAVQLLFIYNSHPFIPSARSIYSPFQAISSRRSKILKVWSESLLHVYALFLSGRATSNMPRCNNTLLTYHDGLEDPLWRHGPRLHALFTIICGISLAIALVFTTYLALGHGLHFSKPEQQKYNIRILWMVTIYCTASFLSVILPQYAAYFKVATDLYATITVSSLFMLLTSYFAQDLRSAKEHFRWISVVNWQNSFPLMMEWLQTCTGGKNYGLLRKPHSGLTWFNIIFIGVFQYNIILIMSAIATLVTHAMGSYCGISNHPSHSHFWILVVNAISATIAMYCLDQFFYQLTYILYEEQHVLKQWHPMLKKWCIKIVLFFSTYQNLIVSILTASWAPHQIKSIVHPSRIFAFLDLTIGLPNTLLCIELAIISIVHLFAFPWTPYSVTGSGKPNKNYQGGTMGWKAFLDAMNPWDIIKSIARGLRWAFVGMRYRRRDTSYTLPAQHLDALAKAARAG